MVKWIETSYIKKTATIHVSEPNRKVQYYPVDY